MATRDIIHPGTEARTVILDHIAVSVRGPWEYRADAEVVVIDYERCLLRVVVPAAEHDLAAVTAFVRGTMPAGVLADWLEERVELPAWVLGVMRAVAVPAVVG